MVKVVMFDLDNTLTDFMKMKHVCCEAGVNAMIKAGLKVDKKKALRILFSLYDNYGIEYETIFQKLLKKLTGQINYDLLAHGINSYREMKEQYIVPYPHVIPTLKKLKKNYKLAIISDAPRIKAWERLVAMKIDRYFDVVITAADVRKQKNTVAPFNAALKALKVKPEEAVMVGDRPDRDIQGAKKAGITTVFVKYGNPKIKKSGADYDIKRVDELLLLLK